MQFFKKIILILIILTIPVLGAKEAEYQSVVIKKGDTLRKISKKYLSDPGKWRELLEYNKISNPHKIKPGLVLKIPASLAKKAIAILIKKKGQVSRKKKTSAPSWKTAKVTDSFFSKELLKTGENSSAKLSLEGISFISLHEKTYIIITEKVNKKKKLRSHALHLRSGKIHSIVKRNIKNKRPFRLTVKTAGGLIKVKGTEFLTLVDTEETTSLACYGGLVEVSAQNKKVLVSKNQATMIIKGQAPLDPITLPEPPSLLIK